MATCGMQAPALIPVLTLAIERSRQGSSHPSANIVSVPGSDRPDQCDFVLLSRPLTLTSLHPLFGVGVHPNPCRPARTPLLRPQPPSSPHPAIQLVRRDPVTRRRHQPVASHSPSHPWPPQRRVIPHHAFVQLRRALVRTLLSRPPAGRPQHFCTNVHLCLHFA